jgi:hypothetical protein
MNTMIQITSISRNCSSVRETCETVSCYLQRKSGVT